MVGCWGWMALKNVTEEKLRIFQNSNCVYHTVRLKPLRHVVADIATQEKKFQSYKGRITLGTWNARIKWQWFEILYISKLKLTGIGHFSSGDHTFCYSGHDKQWRNISTFIVRRICQSQYLGTMSSIAK